MLVSQTWRGQGIKWPAHGMINFDRIMTRDKMTLIAEGKYEGSRFHCSTTISSYKHFRKWSRLNSSIFRKVGSSRKRAWSDALQMRPIVESMCRIRRNFALKCPTVRYPSVAPYGLYMMFYNWDAKQGQRGGESCCDLKGTVSLIAVASSLVLQI